MFSRLLKRNNEAPVYEKRSLLKKDEMAFYGRLRRVLPKCYIFPDIELGSLVRSASTDPRKYRLECDHLQGRKVDFAVFDSALRLLCVIEFRVPADPAAETTPNEAFFKSAGVPYFSWNRETPPTSDQLLRSLSSFTRMEAPKLDTEANHTILGEAPDAEPPAAEAAPRAGGARAEPARAAAPEPAPKRTNQFALTEDVLVELTPHGHIRTRYPHIWQRMVRVLHDPKRLEQYLASLSLQDRAGVRAGFPPDVLIEIADILGANDAMVQISRSRPTSWNATFVNR
ncbi:DUF2726 domain-containing protein [Massilia glaciei]|uniref:DUF2726 domain-containing protein n=1 Tax=Massilia glaciei TaxID=1524097 RepID=A0A2U2HHH8_9BURK|nr:DUF2726 domain-containing protein [Massilia glaciei]PWF45376.1 DUF2726 domain-containing protein [Massilia glaciei]